MSLFRIQCVVISPSADMLETFSRQIADSPYAGSVSTLSEYPDSETIARMLRLGAMEFAVVDCRDFDRAMEVIQQIRSGESQVEIVAACEEDVKALGALLRVGVRDYVPAGSPETVIRETVQRAIERLRGRPNESRGGGTVAAFFPGKPGCGASTVAANTAMAAAQVKAKQTLLIDVDREAPVQSFLHRVNPEHYLQEALANVRNLDQALWTRLVTTRGALSLLPSEADGSAVESGRVQQLLEFARRNYDLICVDLPGTLDTPSVEVLFEAKQVFVVCTQDLAAIHVTMRSVDRLRRLGLDKEMRLLVNRYIKDHVMSLERISGLMNLPVEQSVPNGYMTIRDSVEKGAGADPETPLGKAYQKLARTLLRESAEPAKKEKKFLEFLYQPFRSTNRRTA